MDKISLLSQELKAFLRQNHYKESTLAKYEKELKVLQKFCESKETSDYSLELGNQYAANIARKQCEEMLKRVHCHMICKTKAMDLYKDGIPLPL